MILVTQFLSRKFEAIYNNRPNKKTKFFLQDPTKELFKIFCLSFVFQNQYFSEILMGGQPLDDEISKQYIANVKNFLKIINGLGLYDKKLEIMKEFFQSIRSPKLLQTIQLFLAGIVTRFKSESAHNTEENAIRALTEILGFAIVHLFDFKNPFAGTEDMEGVQKYAAFFAEQNLLCSNVGEYDTLLGTLVKLFTHVMGRAESLQITELYNTNDKDPGSLLVDLAVNQIQTQFKLASVYFLFNKYDQSIECIISAWHMSIQQKSLLLNSLPKQLLQKEQILLIFSSLFARKGNRFLTEATRRV